MIGYIDIEVYAKGEAQAKFLVHGIGDSFWTNDPSYAIEILSKELTKVLDFEPNFEPTKPEEAKSDKKDPDNDLGYREKALGGALAFQEKLGDFNPDNVVEVAEIFYKFLTRQGEVLCKKA